MKVSAALFGLGLCFVTAPLLAGEVTLEKSHICCGKCVKAIEEALANVEGVSEVAVDQEATSVTFQATDGKIARKGVRSLIKAGFGGEAKHNGKAVKFPAPKVAADAKADEVKLTRLHICCGKCVKAVGGAVNSVDGVESAACDMEKGTCTVTGKDINVVKLLEALQGAGFSGTAPAHVEKKKKKDS